MKVIDLLRHISSNLKDSENDWIDLQKYFDISQIQQTIDIAYTDKLIEISFEPLGIYHFADEPKQVEKKYYPYLVRLTTKGEEKLNPKSTMVINGDGNNVNNGHQSDLSFSQDKSLAKQKTTNISPTRPPSKSWLEILSWVIGIVAGLIALYEFVLKKL